MNIGYNFSASPHLVVLLGHGGDFVENPGQAESTVHMLNWTVRSVKFLGVEFDQSEDEEVSVADTTHL